MISNIRAYDSTGRSRTRTWSCLDILRTLIWNLYAQEKAYAPWCKFLRCETEAGSACTCFSGSLNAKGVCVYMIPGTSFIPIRNLISYRVYMEVISNDWPEWHQVSREPSLSQAILERLLWNKFREDILPSSYLTIWWMFITVLSADSTLKR